MDVGKTFILSGAVIAIGACFAPMAHVPVVGSVTYFLDGRGDGKWIILAAGVAALLALGRYYLGGLLAGMIVGGFLCFFAMQFQHAINIAHDGTTSAGMFGGLVEAMAEQIYLDWGYYTIAIGAAGMFIGGIAGMMTRARKPSPLALPQV